MFLNLVFNLGGLFFGGLITWYFSRLYYKKSGDEMATEAARLRHLSTLMLNAMEDAGIVKLNRAQSGEIVGRVVELSGICEGSSETFGQLQATEATRD